jgi:hypothetical protein
MLKKLAFISAWTATAAFASQHFGAPGMNGRDARFGRDGASGQTVVLDVDGASHSFALKGSDGEDAYSTAEDGSSASQCQQPWGVANDLVGAPGGNGGDSARGGQGGDGGNVHLYLPSESKMSMLKNISIVQSGGNPGRDSLMVGRGAPGCVCQQSQWSIEYCTWHLYYTVDGPDASRHDAYDTETGMCNNYGGHRMPPPITQSGNGRRYFWDLSGVENRSFQCTNGSYGSDGSYRGRATQGDYGVVTIRVGADSKAKIQDSFNTGVGGLIGNAYVLNAFAMETRKGLTSLVAQGSEVRDAFYFGKYFQRRVKFEWKPKLSPKDSGVADELVAAKLSGSPDKPAIEVSLPAKFTRKVTELPDTTLVTITHVLNSTDPAKIAACAAYNAKGSYLCEGYPHSCVYENGDCLPK